MFKKTTLKNGLRIITVPQANTEAVTVLALVGTGSKYETKEISGISHFLEHLFFKGTKERPTPLEVIEPLDKVGGIYNAFTGEDYTGYYTKVAAPHLDLALEWVSDIYLNSIFPPNDIERERGVIIEEINMYLDSPMIYVGEVWKDLLYGDQPAGWDVAGNKETIRRISRKQIIDYKESQYTASNTIICVAGNFKEEAVIEKIKKYFSRISESDFKQKEKVLESQKNPKSLLFFKATDQTHFCLGVRAYNLFHPQKYALELLSVILGGSGMMSNRLFTEVRGKKGLAYYISTDAESDSDVGYLVTRAGVDNSKIDSAIEIILREYKKISTVKVSEGELKKAKENVKGKLALSLESSDAKANFYAGQEIMEKEILSLDEIFKRIDKVSANDILKVAKDIFRPKNLNLAMIGPFKDKERFQKILKL
jgi:predicted Zn-dependent peptidase